jgi:hypothetical protein
MSVSLFLILTYFTIIGIKHDLSFHMFANKIKSQTLQKKSYKKLDQQGVSRPGALHVRRKSSHVSQVNP